MKPLFLILAESNAGPIAFIIGLLLIAAVIGYLTAWFYAKSVYLPIIKGLENDKSQLQSQVALLKEDVKNLNVKLEKSMEKISGLEAEIVKRDDELRRKDIEIEKRQSELNKLKKPVQ